MYNYYNYNEQCHSLTVISTFWIILQMLYKQFKKKIMSEEV